MPLPKPSSNEPRDKFVQRCMGNEISISEFPNEDQRFAVCNNIYSQNKFTACLEELKDATTNETRNTDKA